MYYPCLLACLTVYCYHFLSENENTDGLIFTVTGVDFRMYLIVVFQFHDLTMKTLVFVFLFMS